MPSPILTTQFIKDKIEVINSVERRENRANDWSRFQIYNGNLEPSIERAIRKEFTKPETINDLIHRMVPINIIRKIINKLAGVYIETPFRKPVDGSESDQELINAIEDSSSLNIKQKEHNRYFKLFKRNLQEPFVDDYGCIRLRNIPRYQYEVFSHSMVRPEIPDLVVKILVDDLDPSLQLMSFTTDKQHIVVNGKSEVNAGMMMSANNPEGINPYGRLPFVYTNEASYSVDPLPNDDLLRMGVLVPLLLSDLAFASKYQTWSIIWVSGYDGDIPASPSSIISLPLGPDGQKPEIGTVRPDFAMGDALMFIENLVASLLTTNNLSVASFAGQLNANSPASGISKALDESQSTEDKKDQHQYFNRAESELWELLSKSMIPVWRKARLLKPELNKEFSSAFDISVTLRDPKITMTEGEQIKLSKEKLDANLTTLKRELSALNPDFNEDEIEDLEREIIEDNVKRQQIQIDMLSEGKDNGDESQV